MGVHVVYGPCHWPWHPSWVVSVHEPVVEQHAPGQGVGVHEVMLGRKMKPDAWLQLLGLTAKLQPPLG